MLRLQAPKERIELESKPSPREVPLYIRILLSAVFLIVGFAFSTNSTFFENYPLFGHKFLAETLISLLAALVGFYLLPKSFSNVKKWVRKLILDVISDIVSNFWEQQSKRMREVRKQKDILKKEAQKSREAQKKVDGSNEQKVDNEQKIPGKQDKQKTKIPEKTPGEKLEENRRSELKDLLLLDTSVLIDGRILDIAKTGFLLKEVVVPEYVINELHTLSDSKDAMKRQKGRRGLDILKQLKKATGVKITEGVVKVKVENTGKGATERGAADGRVVKLPQKTPNLPVDSQLLEYARNYDMTFVTLDFNLNKVAAVKDLKVININDLANALRMILVPGEELELKIVDAGQEDNQGVGYLDDGTMVVVNKGKDMLGSTVKVKVKKSIQGSAGRMFFAELV